MVVLTLDTIKVLPSAAGGEVDREEDLLEEKWTVKKTHNGEPWTGPLQYESPDGALMMLPSDLALVEDPEFNKIVQQYAKDEKAFFDDFALAFAKLLELGVPFP